MNYGPRTAYQPVKPKKSSAPAIISGILGFIVCAVILFFVFRTLSNGGLGAYSSASSGHHSAESSPSASLETAEASSGEGTETSAGHDIEISDSELIDYFCQVAMNVEYGSANGTLKRWESSIRVEVSGDYTDEDYATLTNHIDTLNGFGILPKISIVSSDANFFIYFVTLDEMDDVIPGYVEGNWGYFYLYWDGDYAINKAYMGIATDVNTQESRNHLILEEFTQALGLMNDSRKYEDSIFQAEWTTTQSLMDIDYKLLYMLYSDYLSTGMGESEVRDILNRRLEDILEAA
jgi:hypothetical protein